MGHFLLLASLWGCGESLSPDEAAPVPPEPVASSCAERGELRGSLSGAITADLEWPDAVLRCESMLRPDDRGIRLRFSSDVGGKRLAIIVALPELQAGETGPEFASVVTITVEGSGRFFSTPNLGACWTAVRRNEALSEQRDRYNVVGDLSCVSPLGEFNGGAFVDVRDLHFSGIADWTDS